LGSTTCAKPPQPVNINRGDEDENVIEAKPPVKVESATDAEVRGKNQGGREVRGNEESISGDTNSERIDGETRK
jgi:hypothetical protein